MARLPHLRLLHQPETKRKLAELIGPGRLLHSQQPCRGRLLSEFGIYTPGFLPVTDADVR